MFPSTRQNGRLRRLQHRVEVAEVRSQFLRDARPCERFARVPGSRSGHTGLPCARRDEEMITIITPLVLGSIVTGGITLLSNPMLFRFLTSLRYPEACRDPPAGETDKAEIRLASEPCGQRSVPALRKVHLRRNGTAVQKVSERTPEYELEEGRTDAVQVDRHLHWLSVGPMARAGGQLRHGGAPAQPCVGRAPGR
jgi:hypothetical protein